MLPCNLYFAHHPHPHPQTKTKQTHFAFRWVLSKSSNWVYALKSLQLFYKRCDKWHNLLRANERTRHIKPFRDMRASRRAFKRIRQSVRPSIHPSIHSSIHPCVHAYVLYVRLYKHTYVYLYMHAHSTLISLTFRNHKNNGNSVSNMYVCSKRCFRYSCGPWKLKKSKCCARACIDIRMYVHTYISISIHALAQNMFFFLTFRNHRNNGNSVLNNHNTGQGTVTGRQESMSPKALLVPILPRNLLFHAGAAASLHFKTPTGRAFWKEKRVGNWVKIAVFDGLVENCDIAISHVWSGLQKCIKRGGTRLWECDCSFIAPIDAWVDYFKTEFVWFSTNWVYTLNFFSKSGFSSDSHTLIVKTV